MFVTRGGIRLWHSLGEERSRTCSKGGPVKPPYAEGVVTLRLIVSALAMFGATSLSLAARAADSIPSLIFADGSVGTLTASCGAGDVCGTLALRNGDRVVIYNAGSSRCKPYQLKLVRFGETPLFANGSRYRSPDAPPGSLFTNCSFTPTTLTVSNGHRFTVFQNNDRTLFGRWQDGDRFTTAARLWDSHDAEPVNLVNGHPRFCTPIFDYPTQHSAWSDRHCSEARAMWLTIHPDPGTAGAH